MQPNWLIVVASSLVPMLLGMIWFSPKYGFGKTWMQATGMTEEKGKTANMPLTFGLAALFNLFVAVGLLQVVIHQAHLPSLLMGIPGFGEEGNAATLYFNDFMEKYGTLHRSFGHGVVHGILFSIMFGLPLIAVHALFEMRGWKYILIAWGYWLVSIALMGGIICQWA